MVGDVVKFWTEGFEVFAAAGMTGEDLKFIRNAFHLVSQCTEELVIHLCFFQYVHKPFIAKIVYNRVLHRFKFILRSFPRDKI